MPVAGLMFRPVSALLNVARRAFLAMKKRRVAEGFYCEDCDKKFPYKSKYERHMVSQSHQRFARSVAQASADEQCHENLECDVSTTSNMDSEPGYDDSDVEVVSN